MSLRLSLIRQRLRVRLARRMMEPRRYGRMSKNRTSHEFTRPGVWSRFGALLCLHLNGQQSKLHYEATE